MASSLKGKADSELRRVTGEQSVVVPSGAAPTDESPTVISKGPPTLDPPVLGESKLNGLARRASTPDSLVAGLRGRRLAHYELIEPVGQGGMAAVIRARDTQLDRFVALKILPPEMAEEQENIDRFHQEARAAAKLDHENIARVFYCGEDQELHFIAFEFVDGANLRTLLDQRGRLPVAEAVRYILQVATGLEHASTRGVVHRDVKPSNIIITPDGRAKLVDMGLARNLERHGERDLTQSGMTLGTFDYISPEQALEPREADARSDIYSLGCTFYHLLTGQPPVPEGTPAKKLHHHQNATPVDPRQIDPAIPDEIVMILGKMMAKNPKDRYQRPIHLVHHLMQVAQKVGAANDVPEGVLFVDAPLPGQQRVHPIMAIGLALLALVVLTLALTFFPGPLSTQQVRPAVASKDSKNGQANSDPGPIAQKKPQAPALVREAVAQDYAEMKQALDDPTAKEIKAHIAATIELETGLVFKGGKDQRLELDAEENGYEGTLFHYRGTSALHGILIDGGEEVVFRKIRFQLDSDGAAPKEGIVAAAVALRGVKKAVFDQCVFAQPKVPRLSPKRGPLASLYIDTPENSEHARPLVILNDCLFESPPQSGGQVAISINGPAIVRATNCAFKPHAALVQLRKNCTLKDTSVELHHCAAFVVHGPVFRFNLGAAAQIYAGHSVFSRPDSTLAAAPPDGVLPQPGLMFLADATSPIQYAGDGNLYHNLNAFVERPNKDGILDKKDSLITKLDQFNEFLARHKCKDQNSSELAASPWAHGLALEQIEDLPFQLKSDYHGTFGLKRTWLDRLMPGPVAVAKNPAPAPKIKVVDDSGTVPGTFRKLGGALAEAKNGDVILIKHGESREIVLDPVELRPGVSVTLRPYEDCQPILMLNKEYKDRDAFLFKLQNGTLQVENMEILLDPVQAGFEAQSIVQLGEAAQCVFKHCVLSLRATNSVQLNVVTFLDLNRMLKMEGPPPPPAKVEFQECYVRGKGDLVALRGCRLLHVDVKNSLVALAGSLLDIESANKVMAMDQGVRWKMERSSIFTTDPIFALRSKSPMGLTRTDAAIERCLLASLTTDQSVVHLDIDDALEKYIMWRGEQNFYANFDKVKIGDWKREHTEPRSEYGKLTFMDLKEDMLLRMWDALPEAFRPLETELDRLGEIGVPPGVERKLMPIPLPSES